MQQDNNGNNSWSGLPGLVRDQSAQGEEEVGQGEVAQGEIRVCGSCLRIDHRPALAEVVPGEEGLL